MKLHELKEARASKTTKMRELLDAAKGEDLADEAKVRFDQLETEVRSLNDKIEREAHVAELERLADAETISGGDGSVSVVRVFETGERLS